MPLNVHEYFSLFSSDRGSAEVRKDKEEIPVKRQKEGKRKEIEDKDIVNQINKNIKIIKKIKK